jgi:hypothetical protein
LLLKKYPHNGRPPVIEWVMASSASVGNRSDQAQGARDSVLVLLRLEGLAVAALTVVFYARSGQSWWLFAALWLVPDLSMLGYLHSPCWGARIYNAVHTYVLPAVLVFSALVLGASASVIPFALIWINHIAVDRLLGYGLKYSNGFGWTHLGRLGSQGAERA